MTPTQIAVTHHEVLFLEHSATTQEADLFNNLHRIMVTNIPKDKWPKIPKTDEMWAQIKKVNMPAHNPYPGAPEQLRMVNNLIGDNANNREMHHDTNLDVITGPQWKHLRAHFLFRAAPMTRCLPASRGSRRWQRHREARSHMLRAGDHLLPTDYSYWVSTHRFRLGFRT